MKKMTSRFPGLKILLVEDNVINQEVTKEILELMECKVDIADNGVLAVEMAKTGNYPLILMDLQLPEIDGYEAAKQIKEINHQLISPIIVALTANALDGDKEKCFKAGMDDYLSKPTKGELLEEMLKKHFSSSLKT